MHSRFLGCFYLRVSVAESECRRFSVVRFRVMESRKCSGKKKHGSGYWISVCGRREGHVRLRNGTSLDNSIWTDGRRNLATCHQNMNDTARHRKNTSRTKESRITCSRNAVTSTLANWRSAPKHKSRGSLARLASCACTLLLMGSLMALLPTVVQLF